MSKRILEVDVHCMSSSLLTAKNIYLDDNWRIKTTCPVCNCDSYFESDIPLIAYGDYFHSFTCHECEWESPADSKMYKLLRINDEDYTAILEFSDQYNLEVEKSKWEKVL